MNLPLPPSSSALGRRLSEEGWSKLQDHTPSKEVSDVSMAQTVYFFTVNTQRLSLQHYFIFLNSYQLHACICFIGGMPWVWQGQIHKCRLIFWEIGVQCGSTAVGQRFALSPNFKEWGLHLWMCPSQTHGNYMVTWLLGKLKSTVKSYYGCFN